MGSSAVSNSLFQYDFHPTTTQGEGGGGLEATTILLVIERVGVYGNMDPWIVGALNLQWHLKVTSTRGGERAKVPDGGLAQLHSEALALGFLGSLRAANQPYRPWFNQSWECRVLRVLRESCNVHEHV